MFELWQNVKKQKKKQSFKMSWSIFFVPERLEEKLYTDF